MAVTTLVPWYGSNRMLADNVGRLLEGSEWVGIPFCGGCCEIGHIKSRTVVANDRHRHLINLAAVVSDGPMCADLVARLSRVLFHPDTLEIAQATCKSVEEDKEGCLWSEKQSLITDPIHWAAAYFTCAWMARNGTAGTKGEFNAGLSVRWDAGGGDSVVRWNNAIAGLQEWCNQFRSRCTFTADDAFDFLRRCKDQKGHGIYADPPFPGPGDLYKHNPGKGLTGEKWQTVLAAYLTRFTETRVVCRFYDVPLIRDLYPESSGWQWVELTGRAQTNGSRAEVLIVRNGGIK